MAEAKIKAEHIRADSERELAAATQRRDSINAKLSNVRQMLAALGGVTIANVLNTEEAPADQHNSAVAAAASEEHAADAKVEGGTKPTMTHVTAAKPTEVKASKSTDVKAAKSTDYQPTDKQDDSRKADSGNQVGAKS